MSACKENTRTKPNPALPNHGLLVSLRVEPTYLDAFEYELQKRGMKRNDGIRELISAWCRTPDVLQIGLPVKAIQ